MKESKYSNLPKLSRGFLSQPEIRQEGSGVIVTGNYDLNAFSPDLFADLSVHRPENLDRAVDKRLAEFLAGRSMAMVAQQALGYVPTQIGIGENRMPVWPGKLAGSISHARSHCACFVVRSQDGDPGIDVEDIANRDALEAILKMTVNNAERRILKSNADLSLNTAATLCFSAKETLFKALYPTVGRFFDFSCANIQNQPTGSQLQLYLTETLHPQLPTGKCITLKYAIGPTSVLTWMVRKRSA